MHSSLRWPRAAPRNRAVSVPQGAEPEVGNGLPSVLLREDIAERAVVHVLLVEPRQASFSPPESIPEEEGIGLSSAEKRK